MTVKVGMAEGVCSQCGHAYKRPRPIDEVVCDCYMYCPICKPVYTVEMEPYTPDLTPTTYGPIESDAALGDTEHPMDISYKCPVCGYLSAQKPVEVRLT